ncbi:AAA family ATPase [Mesosutterella sp. OilRF-GAM-744-9]|uniref:AAA family ATPase n=2 Tax=Mesosutterella TaxID=2494213 RepID=A0ABT7IPN8_9BURK|nr:MULTISPECIES: AAA family ATPase [unclassified Mesosutterella]MCG5031871.1 AAA family ATPase [Mesosutterella sp. oilRF-744-WT-GAM-9]MDL2060339.1 AAA family ATPase [Mesosutterella sp. AGMB02718]MDL2060562.1 AAA family ATPase [Mesosutterella sp. AGMB02718]
MLKSISLFNHKGGVSKTTTAFNLGWALADAGYKVLLVDLDSQCNLTGIVLGYGKMSDGLDNFYGSRANLTLKTIVEQLIDGDTPDNILGNEKGNLFPTQNENLYLLPGSLNISDMDSQVSIALKIAVGIPATRNLPGALPRLIRSLAERDGFDFIIYDMSPNVGGINEVMLMSSDYFIVPTTPDFFCWQAISSLSKHIKSWHQEIDSFKLSVPGRTSSSLTNHPQFLGTIQQRYRIRNQEPAKSFDRWINEIRKAIDTVLIPSLKEIDCIVDRGTVQDVLNANRSKNGGGLNAYDLAHISDFNSLIAMSQSLSKPVFALTDEDIIGQKQFGYALDTMKRSRDSFREQFNRLAKIIEMLTN